MTASARLNAGMGSRNRNKLDPIRYTTTECHLGRLLLATTARGICAVNLADTESDLLEFLERQFPDAIIERDDAGLRRWAQELIHSLSGAVPHPEFPLDVRGTAFQHRVWNAMRKIPRGKTRTYREVARHDRQTTGGPGRGTCLCAESRDAGDSLPSRHRRRRLGPRPPILPGPQGEVAGGGEREDLIGSAAGRP